MTFSSGTRQDRAGGMARYHIVQLPDSSMENRITHVPTLLTNSRLDNNLPPVILNGSTVRKPVYIG